MALAVSKQLFVSILALWVMGCLYNIPPLRTKDVPYLDVLSESINNPIRFCVGWYIVTATRASAGFAAGGVLDAGWLLYGPQAVQRVRQIGREHAILYRRSFLFYTEQSLLVSVLFYAATAMLFFGAFIMRYRMEMIFAFPFIALLMAVYFNLAFRAGQPGAESREALPRAARDGARRRLLHGAGAHLICALSLAGALFPKSGVN